jgi:hypothetical protein
MAKTDRGVRILLDIDKTLDPQDLALEGPGQLPAAGE